MEGEESESLLAAVEKRRGSGKNSPPPPFHINGNIEHPTSGKINSRVTSANAADITKCKRCLPKWAQVYLSV